MKKIYLFILFCSSLNFSLQPTKYEWRTVVKVPDKFISFFEISSEKKFSLVTPRGVIWRYNNGALKRIPSPVPKNFYCFAINKIGENSAVLLARDQDWKTHFYFFEKGVWQKSDFVFPLPMRKIVTTGEKEFFVCGNFGSLIKYENGTFRKIDIPVKSHINFIEKISSDSVFFLASVEGLFFLDKNKAVKIKSDIAWSKTTRIFVRKNKVYIIENGEKYYVLKNDSLVTTENINNVYRTSKDEFGQVTSVISVFGQKEKIEFPGEYTFRDFKPLSKNKILFAAKGGEILLAEKTDKNFFAEKAEEFSLLGSSNSYNFKSVIEDFNNDNFPDILLVSMRSRMQIDLLINGIDRPFILIPDVIKLNGTRLIGQIFSFDFDNDLQNDIAILYQNSDKIILDFYRNNGLKFEKVAEKIFSEKTSFLARLFFIPADIDADGDLDLIAISYYGAKSNPGSIFFLKNKLFGRSWETDTSLVSETHDWNTKTIYADFDNNGLNDILSANKWRKSKLFMQYENGFKEESVKRFRENAPLEDHCVAAADFDNDGDLDVFFSRDQNRIQIYENDGKGFFTDITSKLIDDKVEFPQLTGEFSFFQIEDFNNDNFLDLLYFSTSDNKSVKLLINDNGHFFKDATNEFKIESEKGLGYLTGDINRDGDMDIFEMRNGKNCYWENNASDSNFILIKPVGIGSNANAFGAKVSLFSDDSLIAFRQIGTNGIYYDSQCSNVVLFGAEKGRDYTVTVEFYGGGKIEKQKVYAGEFLRMEETSGISKAAVLLPVNLFGIVSNPEHQLYAAVVIIFTIIIFGGIRHGQKRHGWGWRLSTLLISVNISFAWLLILLNFSGSNFILKFILPVVAAFIGILIPQIFFYLLKDKFKPKSVEETEDELLQLLISFSHGEWALRNLNSLQLFLGNYSHDSLNNDKYVNQLFSRANTFLTMTQETIRKIIVLAREIETLKTIGDEINFAFENTVKFLSAIKTTPDMRLIEPNGFRNCANEINQIKQLLAKLRSKVAARFSCNVKEITAKIPEIYEEKFRSEKITFTAKFSSDKHIALIKANELISVFDNLITNALKALKNVNEKKIEIEIFYRVPKIIINFIDNGTGIETEETEKIFDRGFSGNGGTGEGLFAVRTTLRKYGGRIFVNKNLRKSGAVFTMELIKGK